MIRKLPYLLLSALFLAACPTNGDENGDNATNGDEGDTNDITNQGETPPFAEDPALQLEELNVSYITELDALLFELQVQGDAATTFPEAAGDFDGAPILSYVFPTTLAPKSVGFDEREGTVALLVSSHPDFDDTPYWDENNNKDFDDDGAIYHAHWALLQDDDDAEAGLIIPSSDEDSQLPPTAPLDLYLDSPGFTVITDGSFLRVIVPADRIKRDLDFEVGAQTALMRVDDGDKPRFLVDSIIHELHDGDTSTAIDDASDAPAFAWPDPVDNSEDSLNLEQARATYYESLDSFIFSIDTEAAAATFIPEEAGQLDGAPVIAYAFPVDLDPTIVGFDDIDGQLALTVTTHPDFDDTPLWDENLDGDYENDGHIYHTHWVVLADDEDSPAGLSIPSQTDEDKLPPTAPLELYLDSPGYHAFASNNTLHVILPAAHINNTHNFNFDALTARLRVDASGDAPVVRVEEVIQILSGDLSLPLTPDTKEEL